MAAPDERLSTLPARQFRSASMHCVACRPYHALWPLMRVTRQVGGVEADEPFLGPLLASLIGKVPRHVVLAGSADSGVLALVHRASLTGGATHRFTVVDRCATPFDACRAYADEHGLSLVTLQEELRNFPATLAADLVVGHSVLPFVPLADRPGVLGALKAGLAPGGRVVLSARVSSPDRDKQAHNRDPGELANTLHGNIVARLREMGIELPCREAELLDFVRTWVATDSFHVAPYEQTGALKEDLEAAGFDVEQLMPIGRGLECMNDGRIITGRKQGIVAVTAPKEP